MSIFVSKQLYFFIESHHKFITNEWKTTNDWNISHKEGILIKRDLSHWSDTCIVKTSQTDSLIPEFIPLSSRYNFDTKLIHDIT